MRSPTLCWRGCMNQLLAYKPFGKNLLVCMTSDFPILQSQYPGYIWPYNIKSATLSPNGTYYIQWFISWHNAPFWFHHRLQKGGASLGHCDDIHLFDDSDSAEWHGRQGYMKIQYIQPWIGFEQELLGQSKYFVQNSIISWTKDRRSFCSFHWCF